MEEPVSEFKIIETSALVRIAIFLEGFKLGNGGNIQPLGNVDLEMLWDTIKYIRGDVRYKCPEFEKYHK